MTSNATVPTTDGMFAGITDIDYHKDVASLSVSGAKLLLPPSCPAKFRHRMDTPQKPKAVFDFGHVAHTLILGESSEIAVLDPAILGVKKDGTIAASPSATATWKDAERDARARGAVPIHIDDYQAAVVMSDAVEQHPVAGPLFASGQPERSLYYTDEDTGIRLRARPDWLDGNTIVDLKTSVTAEPDEFARNAWKYGYHQQAAWYIDTVKAVLEVADPRFLLVVVEKSAPHLVSVLEFDAEAINEGRRLNRQAIRTYAACVKDNEWPSYAGNDQVTPISLPPWAIDYEIEIAI